MRALPCPFFSSVRILKELRVFLGGRKRLGRNEGLKIRHYNGEKKARG